MLSNYERETIISFNEQDKIAHIYTYNKVWQRHLEKNLKLEPVLKNKWGGREYEIDKTRVPKPRALRHSNKLTDLQHKDIGRRLSLSRSQNPICEPETYNLP